MRKKKKNEKQKSDNNFNYCKKKMINGLRLSNLPLPMAKGSTLLNNVEII